MSKKQLKIILTIMFILTIINLFFLIDSGLSSKSQNIDIFLISFFQTIWFYLIKFTLIPLGLLFIWWKREILLKKKYLQSLLITALFAYFLSLIGLFYLNYLI